jgi:GAF domain-containing protein
MASRNDAAPELAEMFASLQTLLLHVEGIDDFLQDVAGLAREITVPAVSCGISVEYDGHPLTVASSDAKARALDELQYELDEGPCLHAMRAGEAVVVPDAGADARWRRYFEDARERGLQSSLSLPLVVDGSSIGALNLYGFDTRRDFCSGETRRQADLFATQASTALALALRQAKSDQTTQQLERALSSRSVIDQALGIMMAQQRCDAEEAFALLRAHSQNNNKKLRTVAEELVARTSDGTSPSSA